MKRWHDDAHIARRSWINHRRSHVETNLETPQGFAANQQPPGIDPFHVDCVCDNQVGRFRKRKSFDCGHSRCALCHAYKFPKRLKTRGENLSWLSFCEQVHELTHHG